MVYIIDTNGTTQAVITEPVYQGSTGVNNIILLAPFPANCQITISCILPNGVPLRKVYPMQAKVLPIALQNINKDNYTCFVATVDEMITQLTGTVQVQFQIVQGLKSVNGQLVPRVLATYTTGFEVGVGVPLEPFTIPSESDDLQLILGYLAELNGDPITSVYYTTDSEYLINDKFSTNSSVSVTPSGFSDYISTDFTASGLNSNEESALFMLISNNPGNAGFIVDFGANYPLSIVQLFMYSATVDTVISVSKSTDGITYGTPTTLTINATTHGVPIIPRVYLDGSECRYVRVTFNTNAVINKVQFYEPNNSGKYIITFKSGAIADININATAALLVSQIDGIRATANEALDVANGAAETADVAESNAVFAATMAANANTTANQAISAIPKTYFESSFPFIVGRCMFTNMKTGDVLINTTAQQLDFIVFEVANATFDTSGLTVLTFDMIRTDTLPTPHPGDKYLIQFVNGDGQEIGAPRIGIISVEGGLNAPVVATDSELSETSTNPVQNRVITQALHNINTTLGDVEVALDNIITLQENYINGGTT